MHFSGGGKKNLHPTVLIPSKSAYVKSICLKLRLKPELMFGFILAGATNAHPRPELTVKLSHKLDVYHHNTYSREAWTLQNEKKLKGLLNNNQRIDLHQYSTSTIGSENHEHKFTIPLTVISLLAYT
jgi:hypothetical protein